MYKGVASGLAVTLLLSAVLHTPASVRADPPPLGRWEFMSHRAGPFTRSQGLATDPSSPGTTVYSWRLGLERTGPSGHVTGRSFAIPFELLLAGYLHVGDVDSHAGRIYLPYESDANETEKAFGVVDARTLRIAEWSVHHVGPGETDHNSWVAVSPDGDWLASGEWDDMTSILVFAVEDLGNPEVDVAFRIRLTSPLDRVQGCDFAGPVQLVCLDDTEDRDLIQIDLARALDGLDVEGHPTALGGSPLDHAIPWLAPYCAMPTEAEGVDVSGSTLRFLTIDPCQLWTHEYRYRLTPGQ